MIPVEEFKEENREILDLCHILDISVDQYSLRKNKIVCELLHRFSDRVTAHLAHADRSIYRDLLQKHTPDADKLADQYLTNTSELKKIFNVFTKGWCFKSHNEADHPKYVDETREIFRLVCDRITFEEEKIFPYFEPEALSA